MVCVSERRAGRTKEYCCDTCRRRAEHERNFPRKVCAREGCTRIFRRPKGEPVCGWCRSPNRRKAGRPKKLLVTPPVGQEARSHVYLRAKKSQRSRLFGNALLKALNDRPTTQADRHVLVSVSKTCGDKFVRDGLGKLLSDKKLGKQERRALFVVATELAVEAEDV